MLGRMKHAVLIAGILAALTGCRISRNIRDLEPVTRPRLQDLERHLTYSDPDDGRPTYVLTR